MNNAIISIGRQFGSGGRAIGQMLSQRLGYEYYDKELLAIAAKEIGFDPKTFEAVDEKPQQSGLFRFMENFVAGGGNIYDNYMSGDMLFKVQSDVIRKLSEEKSCVIVGRCSDYVLRDNPRCISVFIHSSSEDRIKRLCERMNLTEEKAVEKMRQTDKQRASYYNYYSNKLWGVATSYDLSINVSALGEAQTVDFIESFVKQRISRLNK